MATMAIRPGDLMSRRLIDRGVAIFIVGICIGLYSQAKEFPLGSDLFPKFSLITVMVLAVLMFGETFFGKGVPSKKVETELKRWDVARPYLLFGLSLLFALMMYLIGFLAAAVLTTLMMMPVLGVRKRLLYGLVTGGIILFIYLLFNRFLMVQLPIGRLFS